MVVIKAQRVLTVAGSSTSTEICQPLAADRAEVAQESPRFPVTSPAVFEEYAAASDQGRENGQSYRTRHGVDLRRALVVQRVFASNIGQTGLEV
jgi:hypothetical protein